MSMQRGSDWLGNLVTPDEYAIAVERFTYRRGDETETFTIDGLSDFVGALFDLASSRVTQQQQAAPGAVPDGWKPIETAPKDGTVILVTDTFTYRSDPEKKPHHVYRAVRWNEEGYGWEIYNDGEIIDQDGPTFWMPLPAEPGAMLSASPAAPAQPQATEGEKPERCQECAIQPCATCPDVAAQPQAQGEPEVVAIADGTFNCVAPLGMPLITLQSHREAIAKRDAALQACVEALEAINKECFSHVDGRDLFAQMHPRNTLDIKRRVDARETWFEGDWLTDLWGQIKKSRAAITQAEEARK